MSWGLDKLLIETQRRKYNKYIFGVIYLQKQPLERAFLQKQSFYDSDCNKYRATYSYVLHNAISLFYGSSTYRSKRSRGGFGNNDGSSSGKLNLQ